MWGHPKAYSNPVSDPEQRPYVMISGYFHPFRFTIPQYANINVRLREKNYDRPYAGLNDLI